MSGGVPAGELRDFASLMVDEVIAKVRIQLDAGESLSVADQRLMLEQLIVERKRLHATPTPPIEGRDADVERVEVVAKAMAPLAWHPLEPRLHGSPVARRQAQEMWRKHARTAIAALQALGERG